MNKLEEWIKEVRLRHESEEPHSWRDLYITLSFKIIEHLMNAVEYYSKDEKRFIREIYTRDSNTLEREYLTFDSSIAKKSIEACEQIIKEKT